MRFKRLASVVVFACLVAAVPGERAPALRATGVRGERVALESLRGRVVVVDFWASWCEPCRREFPVLEGLAARDGARGLTVVGVSVDEDLANCQRFVRELHPSFAIVHDGRHALAEAWAPPSMPTTYVIDRQGNVADVLTGADVQQIEARVNAALAR